jgi:hypothetical protein
MQLYAKNPAPLAMITRCALRREKHNANTRKTLIGGGHWVFDTPGTEFGDRNRQMRHIVSAACGLWLCLAGSVLAQGKPGVVVELYTSQGCSSCPPADEFMAELAQADGVIALSLHVDYWDYIGWEDSFAQSRFTDRQKAYARASGSRMIYTPQMIVGGTDRVEGHTPETVVRKIGKHMNRISPVRLSITRDGDTVVIRAEANPPLDYGTRVQLVRYLPSATVTIERGENAGRTVVYSNVVTSWEVVGEWPGQSPLELLADAPGDDPVVVIVQRDGPSEILAAARLD